MRKQILWLIGAAGAIIFLAGFVWVYVTSARAAGEPYAWAAGPAKVVGTMDREVASWQAGPHLSVACLECHLEVDPDQLRQAYAQGNEIDLTAWLEIDQVSCEECHESQMESIKQDLIPAPLRPLRLVSETAKPMPTWARHDLHLQEGLECTDCHAVHDKPISEQNLDAHQLCLDCHKQKDVTITVTGDVSCSACHADLAQVTPDDHKNAAVWRRAHGKAVGTQDCSACHLADTAGPHGEGLADPAAFPGQSQEDACLSCHAGLEMPHPASFLAEHGRAALAAREGTCETCHGSGAVEEGAGDQGGQQLCSACHLLPMPHPSDFLQEHGAQAKQTPAACTACHSSKNPVNPTAYHATESYCTDCHSEYQHRQGWVVTHGDQPQEDCATCHSTEAGAGTHNACSACHTADGQWHPEMFFITHARQVEAEGDGSCQTCHSEVEPSCSKCHAAR